MTISKNLNQFFSELICAIPNAGEHSVSPTFTREDGMDREAYLAHERAIFQKIGPICHLHRGWRIELEPQHIETNFQCVAIRLINADGDLIYEWIYTLDSLGQIIGNNSNARTIAKMQYINGKWSRALAVTSLTPIINLVPLFPCVWQKRIEISDDKLFWNFCFLPEHDTGQTFWGEFRIRYQNGNIEKKHIWLRGLDRPNFINVSLSLSEDGKTLTHNARLPWSINVKFEDNEAIYLEFPITQKIIFSKPVVWACLTDALDYDWILSKKPVDFLDF